MHVLSNPGMMFIILPNTRGNVSYLYLIFMYAVSSSFTDRDYRDLNLKAERGRIELSSAIRRFSQVVVRFVVLFSL